jgi:hypothetical protein
VKKPLHIVAAYWKKHFWPVVTVAGLAAVPGFAQDRQRIEKNLPDDFYGEWCFAEPDNGTTGANYKLPSWADTCDKNKVLSIGRQWFEAGNT